MKHAKRLLVLTFSAILFFASCSKHDSTTPAKVYKSLNDGLYVLDEGSGDNGTELTYYDLTKNTPATDIFEDVNGLKLGTYGNDILIFGEKIYIVMNGSSNVTVLDKRTAKLLTQIKAADGDSWQPRNVISTNGKILVSAWDGTVSVIDTSSLQITNTIKAGTNLETMAVVGNTLYVASSGAKDYTHLDSTVSVIDLVQGKEIQKIKVGINPQQVVADSKGNIYVLTWDVYDNSYTNIINPSKIYKIDASAQKVTDSSSVLTNSGKMIIYNDNLYLTGIDYNDAVVFSTANLKSAYTNFVTDGTTVKYPYGLDIDETNGDVYIIDGATSESDVYCFDKTGKQKFSFKAGVFSDKVVFLR